MTTTNITDLDFPALMSYLRTRKGMSARGVSSAAGVSPSYVAKLERGDFVPTVDTFARLVKVLECSDLEILVLLRTFNS